MKNNKLKYQSTVSVTLLLVFRMAVAAPPPTFQQLRPGDEALDLPAYEPEQRPETLQLPPLPVPRPDSRLSRQASVHVREIRLDGNTVFSDEALGMVTAGYINRKISTEELQELRYQLTLYYIERGYINSGAIIPDQRVIDGIITLQIIEGELSEVDVTGLQRLKTGYISKRIMLGAGPPLNITTLGERLQILQQDPLIEQLNATLAPGLMPGESRLNVQIEEARPYEVWMDLGNTQSPSVGGTSAGLRGRHRNLNGHGDTLELSLIGGEGLKEGNLAYAVPLNARDTTLGLAAHRVDSEVVEAPFDALNVESEEQTFSLSLSHHLLHSLNETLTLGVSLDLRRSQTFLHGSPFPFVPGTDNGESRLSVLRLSQEWQHRRRNQVFAARSLLSSGINAFDATVNDEPGDGKFVSWLGQFQWARRLAWRNMQVIFRGNAQLANGRLPSMEQFTVGGINTVRGYRENRLIADTGLVASIETRIPIHDSKSGSFDLMLAPFVDYGQVGNRTGSDPARTEITSAGIGLLGNFRDRLHFSIHYGHAFDEFDDVENDLQDTGFSFALSARLL